MKNLDAGVPSQRDQFLEARLAQVDAEPDHEPERDVDDERIADAPAGDDRAPDVPGQEYGSQNRRRRDQVDHGAGELEDREWQDHGSGQSQMSHGLIHIRPSLELDEGAEQEQQRCQYGEDPPHPHDLLARGHDASSIPRKLRVYPGVPDPWVSWEDASETSGCGATVAIRIEPG